MRASAVLDAGREGDTLRGRGWVGVPVGRESERPERCFIEVARAGAVDGRACGGGAVRGGEPEV